MRSNICNGWYALMMNRESNWPSAFSFMATRDCLACSESMLADQGDILYRILNWRVESYNTGPLWRIDSGSTGPEDGPPIITGFFRKFTEAMNCIVPLKSWVLWREVERAGSPLRPPPCSKSATRTAHSKWPNPPSARLPPSPRCCSHIRPRTQASLKEGQDTEVRRRSLRYDVNRPSAFRVAL